MAILRRMLGLGLMLVLVCSCSSSTMEGSWVSPGHIGKIENVYIVGFIQDELIQRIFEDSFGAHLFSYGVTTVLSYTDLPAREELNRNEIIKTMTENGFDSVLFINVVNQQSEGVISPGNVYYDGPNAYGRSPYYDRSGYYSRGGYDRRGNYAPGRYYTRGRYYARGYRIVNTLAASTYTTILTIESELYDLQTGEMIWLTNLEVVDEVNIEKMIQDYVEVVTKDLKERGLI